MTMWGEFSACSFPTIESTYVATDAWGYFVRYCVFPSPAVTILWWSTMLFLGCFSGKFEAIFRGRFTPIRDCISTHLLAWIAMREEGRRGGGSVAGQAA